MKKDINNKLNLIFSSEWDNNLSDGELLDFIEECVRLIVGTPEDWLAIKSMIASHSINNKWLEKYINNFLNNDK